MQLVWPSTTYLPSYIDALRRGWSSDNLRPEAAHEALEHVARDPSAFLAELVDPEGKGPPITLADGTTVPRLPGYHRWMWDGEFCGDISFRWQPGTTELPPTCLGHMGYSVVPWKQQRGYATKALALLLSDVRHGGTESLSDRTRLQALDGMKPAASKFPNPTPLAWWQTFDGGREFYIALGHDKASYGNPILTTLITNAIVWATTRP